jgi:putative DNA primase/helicase
MTEREQEYRDCAERVAREVLGEPNKQFCNGKELRWGNHGSMALDLKRGIFFSHELNEGGGVRWLLRSQLGLDEPAIDAWLQHRRYISGDDDGDGCSRNGSRRSRRKIVAVYDYVDALGALLFQVVRFEPKDFRQRKPNGAGGWTWSTKGVGQVPYRLAALTEAIANEWPAIIVEGEKDVDQLARWNVPATCNAGGAGKWRHELNEHFRGADVVLIPDNDKAGYDHIGERLLPA